MKIYTQLGNSVKKYNSCLSSSHGLSKGGAPQRARYTGCTAVTITAIHTDVIAMLPDERSREPTSPLKTAIANEGTTQSKKNGNFVNGLPFKPGIV
jgi:hypothetical protein